MTPVSVSDVSHSVPFNFTIIDPDKVFTHSFGELVRTSTEEKVTKMCVYIVNFSI